jgi:hypothetical protein
MLLVPTKQEFYNVIRKTLEILFCLLKYRGQYQSTISVSVGEINFRGLNNVAIN